MNGTRDAGRQWRGMHRKNKIAHAGAWISAGLLVAAVVPAQTDWMRARVLEPRRVVAMAYDTSRERVVLFGGQDGSSRLLGDTLEWSGVSWTRRNPAASPTARGAHAMAHDAARQRVVLFGGHDGLNPLGDTWEWDGVTWAQRNPAASPTARLSHALAYDSARQRVVLFGGWSVPNNSPLADTWEWDGVTWARRNPAASPTPRSGHALAYDAARQRVVLFGGLGAGVFGDIWEWDGVTWAQRNPAASPTARSDHALAYDAARQRVVLLGGDDGLKPLGDTWVPNRELLRAARRFSMRPA